MKNILALLSLILLLSSCHTTYKYSIVASDTYGAFKSEEGQIVAENDTLSLTYSIIEEDGSVEVTIHNKIDIPVSVDWEDSFFTMNGKSIPYSTSRSSLIAPNKKRVYSLFYIEPLKYKGVKNGDYTSIELDSKKAKIASFVEKNSPLKFNNYLSIVTDNDREFVFDQDFYVSNQIVVNNLSPDDLPPSLENREDIFYAEKKGGFGHTMGKIGIGAAKVVGITVLVTVLTTFAIIDLLLSK